MYNVERNMRQNKWEESQKEKSLDGKGMAWMIQRTAVTRISIKELSGNFDWVGLVLYFN